MEGSYSPVLDPLFPIVVGVLVGLWALNKLLLTTRVPEGADDLDVIAILVMVVVIAALAGALAGSCASNIGIGYPTPMP